MVRARGSCSNLKMGEIDVINSSKLRMVCTKRSLLKFANKDDGPLWISDESAS